MQATPPNQRRAPIQAQRVLGELIEKLPYAPAFPHEFNIVVYQGEAIYLTQQVCLAIKQHNEIEKQRKEARWQEQLAQGKKPGGVVTLPDYEMNIIPWILKYRLIDKPRNPQDMNQSPGYSPRATLYADIPRGRKTKAGKMDELIAKLFPQKVLDTAEVKQDPFEKWLHTTSNEPDANTSQDKSGIDEHPPIMQTTNPRNGRGTPTLGTCPDLPPHKADI